MEQTENDEETRFLPENGNTNNVNRIQMKKEGEKEVKKEGEKEVKGGDEYDNDMVCGWGRCAPKWFQIFRNQQMFLVVFCIACVLQGMWYTYFVSVISTIEKLFQIQSKTTGIILSATEIGQISGALILTYYGGQGHRPKWIGSGIILFAICVFICSLPNFIFGDELLRGDFKSDSKSTNTSTLGKIPTLCASTETTSVNVTDAYGNGNQTEQCPDLQEVDKHTQITEIVMAFFFICFLGVGVGQTTVYNLGIPYIDDNVTNKESPLYFAITTGVKIVGPALGFLLGSLCTSIYHDLTVPNITLDNPRWIGAWWLGMLLLSAMLIIDSFFMFAFPRRLIKKLDQPLPTKKPRLRDFPKAVKSLLTNEMLLWRTASSVLHILPIAGLYTFLPKYLENQFRLTAKIANMISGLGGILVMGIGIFFSGFYIRRFRPSATFVAGWIALTALGYSLGMMALMFIGCQQPDLQISPSTNTSCQQCPDKYYPVCGSDNRTYFSPCYAGCTDASSANTSFRNLEFYNCANVNNENDTATNGLCPTDCNALIWYIVVFCASVLIHSTSEVGGMLITLRCVDPNQKAMAMGLIAVAIGLFGNVPCPIIYGAVVDAACIKWDESCGQIGACWIYNKKDFRMYLHGTTAAVMFLAFLVDCVVWYKAKEITLDDEAVDENKQDVQRGETAPKAIPDSESDL